MYKKKNVIILVQSAQFFFSLFLIKMHESVAKTTCFVKSIELLISFKVLTIHCTL